MTPQPNSGQDGAARPQGSAGSDRPRAKGRGARPRPTDAQPGEARAGRQRDLSARATAERETGLRAAASRRRTAAEASGLLWTRPPEKPTRYPLRAVVSDTLHGWLDGRRGLPRLPDLAELMPRDEQAAAGEDRPAPPSSVAVARALAAPALTALPAQDPNLAQDPAQAPASVLAGAAPPTWLLTPRMVLLRRQALERVRAEEEACIADCARYRSELSHFYQVRDTASASLGQAKAALDLARQPLSEEGLATRRLAEQKTQQDYPESFVRARRQAEWARRLEAATQAVKDATAQLASATREAALREDLIRDRTAVARAAAHRHLEFHVRRIATYLQQLARTHKQGGDLNMLLIRYQDGHELPDWTRNPPAGNEESGQ